MQASQNQQPCSNYFSYIEYVLPLFIILAIPRLGAAFWGVLNYLVPITYLFITYILLIHPKKHEFGLSKPNSIKNCFISVISLIVIYLSTSWILLYLFGATDNNWNKIFFDLMLATIGSTSLPVFMFVGIAMLSIYAVEEFYFRGLLLSNFLKSMSPWIAITIVSLLWALLHLGTYGLSPPNLTQSVGMLPSVFVMGLCLGWIRVFTGSVFICVICQATANSILLIWSYFVFSN